MSKRCNSCGREETQDNGVIEFKDGNLCDLCLYWGRIPKKIEM